MKKFIVTFVIILVLGFTINANAKFYKIINKTPFSNNFVYGLTHSLMSKHFIKRHPFNYFYFIFSAGYKREKFYSKNGSFKKYCSAFLSADYKAYSTDKINSHKKVNIPNIKPKPNSFAGTGYYESIKVNGRLFNNCNHSFFSDNQSKIYLKKFIKKNIHYLRLPN
ncbi:MAG: hypothetical protein ACYCTB_09795 [bacterium]